LGVGGGGEAMGGCEQPDICAAIAPGLSTVTILTRGDRRAEYVADGFERELVDRGSRALYFPQR
jgi:hypothetical protein